MFEGLMSRWMIPLVCACWIALTDLHEQIQAALCREPLLIAILGDGDPADQLHDEVRSARVGGPRVQHLGDVGVVHQRQRLALRLEAANHVLGVEARLNELERDLAADRLLLHRHVDDAEAALANALQQLVAANRRPHSLGRRREIVSYHGAWLLHHDDRREEVADPLGQLWMLRRVLIDGRALAGAVAAQEVFSQLA
jgi:hypothetical protein